MSKHRETSPIAPVTTMAPMTPAAIDISVVIHRIRVVTVARALNQQTGNQRTADARGSGADRERLIDGVPSALSAYRMEVP